MPLRIASIVVLLVATGAVAGEQLLGREAKPGYAEQVAQLCKRTDDSLRFFRGNYFDTVVYISARKHQALTQLDPPKEYAAMHRELVRGEAVMTEQATAAQTRVAHAMAAGGALAVDPAEFHTLRAAQAELESRYRRLGIEGCSD